MSIKVKNRLPLQGKIALVTGATRGAGRGIACMLGEAGATVYCAGRSTGNQQATPGRPETIEQTARMVTDFGGRGRSAVVDFTDEAGVIALMERIEKEEGHLDILVNDIWGGDAFTEWGKPFWELDPGDADRMYRSGILTHIIGSRYAVPLLKKSGKSLLVEVTDGDAAANRTYRGHLYYDWIKTSIMRLTGSMATELRDSPVVAVAVSPGYMRSEAILDHWQVKESNWTDAIEKDPFFIASESPFFIGRGVAALACDPNVRMKVGKTFASWTLAREYGFTDIDGRRPDFEHTISEKIAERWQQLLAEIRKRIEHKTAFEGHLEDLELHFAKTDDPGDLVRYPITNIDLLYQSPVELAVRILRSTGHHN